MTSSIAVTDASPLIILHQIGRLDLLRGLFLRVFAPPAVAREIMPSLGGLPSWVREQQSPTIPEAAVALDPGEREAIALALHLSADAVILDDLAGRRIATQSGLPVIGSVGLLLEGHQRGLISVVRPDLDAMVANGLYVGRRLYQDVLVAAGESTLHEFDDDGSE